MRRLIVNADDFGFSSDVNEGIVEACRRGLLRATSLMANGRAFEHAVRVARSEPELDVGAHLMLVDGPSLAEPGSELPASVAALIRQMLAGKWPVTRIEAEFRAQVEKIRQAGIAPTHADAHKHTHLLPPVLEAVVRVSRDYGIGWVRRPFDVPLTAASRGAGLGRKLTARLMRPLDGRFQRKIAAAGLRATETFAGFQLTGAYNADELALLIRGLPEGVTEFMCHPGYCTDELRATKTRLKESRRRELDALTAPETLEAARQAGVEICSFRDLF